MTGIAQTHGTARVAAPLDSRRSEDRQCMYSSIDPRGVNHRAGKIGFDHPGDFARAKEVLSEAGYHGAQVSKLLKGRVPSAPSAADLSELMELTSGHSPLETLVRLFLFNVEASVEDTQRAFGSMKLDSWVEAGVVQLEGNVVIPTIRILLFRGLYVAVESTAASRLRQPDFVLGVTGSSATLAELMIPRPARRMLDLGTGCGIQALLAAAFCEQVHATDVNPRAIMFTRFNVQLNGLSNVSVAQGDLFEPVGGLSFDLITSNPPYVISPDSEYVYRDNDMQGDSFVQRIILQAPEFLEEGGFCQVSCNWAHFRKQRWQERIARWFEGTGCDAWAIRRFTQTPSAYTKFWCDGDEDPSQAADHYRRWMAYYEREDIEAISMGLITLRRRKGGANWIRQDDWTAKLGRGAGDDILQGFETQDFLERTRDDAMLLQARVRVSRRVRLEQKSEPSAGGFRCVQARLSRVGGLACSGDIDLPVLNLVGLCDGTRRLKDVLDELSTSLPGDTRSLSAASLPTVRRLIASGILLPGVLDPADGEGEPESHDTKVMVLLRGLPSCGKTVAARKVAAEGGVHIGFDEYFYRIVGTDPSSYDWSHDLMPQAREWNLKRILRAIDAGESPIIIDSDNVPGPFTRQYVAHAVDRGYRIRFHEPESERWHAIRELLEDKQANAEALRLWAQRLTQVSKRTHRVPLHDILHRINRWEETSVEQILAEV